MVVVTGSSESGIPAGHAPHELARGPKRERSPGDRDDGDGPTLRRLGMNRAPVLADARPSVCCGMVARRIWTGRGRAATGVYDREELGAAPPARPIGRARTAAERTAAVWVERW